MDGELSGPHVRAARSGTADAGGGQLVCVNGELAVRGKLHVRRLGAIAQLHQFRILDLARRQAEAVFLDGSNWQLECEGEGDLFDFGQRLEQVGGRVGLVIPPPTVRENLAKELTPQRKKAALLVVGAALLVVPVRMVAALALPLAGALLTLGGLLTLLLLLALLLETGLLAGLRRWARGVGAAAALALPLALALGAGLGLGDARTRSREQQAALEKAQALAAEAQEQATRQATERAEAKIRAAELSGKLRAAVEAKNYEEAAPLRDALKELAPEHPVLAELTATLEQLGEQDRVRGLALGIAAANRITRDRVRCETAKEVSDAWRRLSAAKMGDERYVQARDAAAKLERCRLQVQRAFGRAARDGQRQQRRSSLGATLAAIRRELPAATASLEGESDQQLRVESPTLESAAIDALIKGDGGGGQSFLDRMAAQGITKILFVSDTTKRDFKLKVPGAAELTRPLMERFGLADELSLPPLPEEDQEVAEVADEG
ncbi:MAG: hypothetical protein OEZ06_05305 [Myxococcales bacterium]|nr:hypothetical protein [Myxococcales bacterium]